MTVAEDKTYENINPLFHNAVNEFSKEEIEQANKFADNLYYRVGVNTIPCHVKSKNDKYISILKSWKQYQNNEIPKETFESWKEAGLFAYGIGVITGTIYRTENKGKFLTIIDIDRLEAVEKFAECSGKDIKDIASWTRVEWHENVNSYHIFFITQKQFKNIGAGHGLEVHANNNLIFTSNSIHPDGNRWKVIDNESIVVLSNSVDLSVLQIAIDRFLRESTTGKLGYHGDDDEEAMKEFMSYINNPNVKLTKGQRNPALYAQAKSYFFKYTGEFENLSDDAKLVKLKEWHEKQCEVPLTQEPGRQNEVEEVWNKVKRYSTGRREEERNKREDELKRIKEDLKRNPGMCEKKQIQSATLLKENIKSWLSKDIWTIVSEDPIKLIVARRKEGDIVRAMVEKKKVTVVYDDDKEEIRQDIQILNVGTVIFRVYPIKIVLHESPLKFLESPSTYSITFEDQVNQQFTLNGTVEQIIAQLKEYPGCVISAYGVNEVLNAIIAGFRDDGKLEVDSTLDFEGYYYHNNDICMSKIDLDTRHPVRSKEEVIDCCNYLDERAEFQVWEYKGKQIDRRDLLSSAIQWTIAAPFNFAIKQITNKKYWIKIFDFSGERDGGKSGLSQEMLTIHGNNITQKDAESIYSLSIGSASTESKLGRALSRTTYPIEISEIGQVESYGKNENLVEVLKTAVDGLITRRGRDMNNSNRYDTPFASCSPIIMNGNSFVSRKGELIKRMHIATFSQEDRHDRNPKSAFNLFQTENSHKYKILGDWTIRYILDNKNDLLLSGKYTVYEIAKVVLTEFYHFANRQVPEWLTTWITDYALEELDLDDETIIRSILFELVNHTLERNSKLVDIGNKVMKEYDDGRVYQTGQIKNTTLRERILTCIENDLWPWFRKVQGKFHDNNVEKYYIDASILELFSKRLPQMDLKKLGEKMGFMYSQRKGGARVLKCSKDQLIDFIYGKDLTEEEETIK